MLPLTYQPIKNVFKPGALMKKLLILFIAFLVTVMILTSCSYETCPTYSRKDNVSKYGQKVHTQSLRKNQRAGIW